MPRTKQQERWQRARDVAEVLGVKTMTAWSCLKELEREDLVEPILEGIKEAVEIGAGIAQQRDGKLQNNMQRNASDVKLMLWAFDKIGDLERIRVAYRKALDVVS